MQQLHGAYPRVDKLARPLIDRQKYPSMRADDGRQAQIRALVVAELVANEVAKSGQAVANVVLAAAELNKRAISCACIHASGWRKS